MDSWIQKVRGGPQKVRGGRSKTSPDKSQRDSLLDRLRLTSETDCLRLRLVRVGLIISLTRLKAPTYRRSRGSKIYSDESEKGQISLYATVDINRFLLNDVGYVHQVYKRFSFTRCKPWNHSSNGKLQLCVVFHAQNLHFLCCLLEIEPTTG